jgi:hypothetical protein
VAPTEHELPREARVEPESGGHHPQRQAPRGTHGQGGPELQEEQHRRRVGAKDPNGASSTVLSTRSGSSMV